jgi:DNA-3-methyladenine glycosylase I
MIGSKKDRCEWSGDDPLMTKYHDEEWGRPVHDDRTLFEFLILEGAQAGLSWRTILNKREEYRKALSGFDANKISRYGAKDIQRLLANSGIVRNRLKIGGAIKNARAFLEIQKEFGSFDAYIWQFVGGKPVGNKVRSMRDVRSTSKESDAMSKDLRARGFTFIGTTICYAFMQAVGMVNDHETSCYRYKEKL